jgi:hypothetical protein
VPARFKDEERKWIYPISRFLTSVNRENGSLALDPFASYPIKSYMVIELLQQLFVEHIKEKNEEAIKRSRRKR